MTEQDFKLIITYTRAQALSDGVLVDVSTQARAAGFKMDVAMSAGLYHEYVVPPDELLPKGQSLEGRLHDVFMMTAYAAKERWDGSRVDFEVLFLMGDGPRFETVKCVAGIDADDDGNPCLTIFRPEDD